MLARAASVLIVVFWLGMTLLLLRKEFGPTDFTLREVPLAHVEKLILLHEQPSDLQIYSDKLRVGHLRIVPHAAKEGQPASIEFSGTLQVAVPGLTRQQIAWKGTVQLDSEAGLSRLDGTLSLREPATYMLDVHLEPASGRATYEERTGGQLTGQGTLPLNEEGMLQLLRERGISPGVVAALRPGKSAAPVCKAHQAALEVSGQKVDTYLVSIEQQGQTLIEFHVDQLGHVLHAKTFLGYNAAPDDMVP